jgi:hypothetical protein
MTYSFHEIDGMADGDRPHFSVQRCALRDSYMPPPCQCDFTSAGIVPHPETLFLTAFR